MAVDAHALVLLAEVKEMLGLTDVNATRDAQIQQAINDVSQVIEDVTQSAFVQRTLIEDYPWREFGRGMLITTQPPANFIIGSVGGNWIKLRRRPIVSVTSIVDPSANEISATAYTIHKNKGVLEGLFFPPFDSNSLVSYWTITYVAGKYADTAALAADLGARAVVRAAKMAIAEWYAGGSSGGSKELTAKTVGPVSYQYKANIRMDQSSIFALPERAMKLLGPYMNYSI